MPIPNNWPTPGNPDSRVRIFRIEIERPLVGYPTLKAHIQEAVDVAGKTFLEHRPDLEMSIGLADALADPELAPFASVIAPALEEMTYLLYTRKKAEIEG